MASLDRFLRDVRAHQMQVLRDDGVNRHLTFRTPGTSCYWFEILTWPGALCIRGDCGTYVFSRIEDMFGFFRGEPGWINPQYWEEKCEASARHQGTRRWSERLYRAAVVRHFREYWRGEGEFANRRACWEEVRRDVLAAENEHEAMVEVQGFEWEHPGSGHRFRFEDFWEATLTEFTFHYLWNLHAIVWAIAKYDASKATPPLKTEWQGSAYLGVANA